MSDDDLVNRVKELSHEWKKTKEPRYIQEAISIAKKISLISATFVLFALNLPTIFSVDSSAFVRSPHKTTRSTFSSLALSASF